MKVSELKEKLNLEYVNFNEDAEVEDVYIGDMLSVVMSKAPENSAWLTVQTNINITAVAVLVGVSCIIVVEGMDVDAETVKKAQEQGVNILRSEDTAYELAVKISALL